MTDKEYGLEKEMIEKEPVLISACLLGVCCRYKGDGQLIKEAMELKKRYHLVPVCPEILGGLPTPRTPAEIKDGRVISRDGRDVTDNFLRGARETLKIASFFGCRRAVLKERSPSCGAGFIYDGNFCGQIIKGDGITAALLKEHGIQVVGESEIHTFLSCF